ncbi:MAG: hypothetical protein RBT63_06855, partial [Bdellovibrionales bacterium]|nr:hypothetical protein [Bdellovibrionales bacterium]
MKPTKRSEKTLTRSQVLLIAALIGQVGIACAKREVPVTKHEGPVVGDEIVTPTAIATVDVEALRKLDPDSINARIESARVSGNVGLSNFDRVAIMKSLRPFILNSAYVEDPRQAHTKQMRSALTAFNRTLVDLATSGPEGLKQAAPWLKEAGEMIESGCDGSMRGCNNIGFYRSDANSAKIMELWAQSLNDQIDMLKRGSEARDGLVRLYYRRLGVAFDLRNRIADTQFEFLYLARAAEYAEAFGRSTVGSRERELLVRHSEVFELILNRFNPDLSNPSFRSQFEEFVNAFSPWNYSHRVDNPFGQAATRMLSLAAKNFLYRGKDGQLSSSLQESIKVSQETTESNLNDLNESLDASFASIVMTLKEQEAQLWRNLLLSDDFQRDEYFFMIDRIFGDHLTPDDASEIWQGSRRNSKALLTTAEHYIKIQIAAQIVRTNRYMSEMYSNREWSSTTLFQNAVEKSYPISTQWNQLLARIERIQLFLDRNLKSSDESLYTDEFRNVNQMLTSIRRNIKYLSVYPNMMLMAYFLAEAKFKLEVYTFFGRFEIDSADIITWFFDGRMRPLFNFGNDGEALKRIETLYAFLFALKTETFKAFSVSATQKLDEARFFEVVVGKFLDSDRIDLETALESLRRDMRQSNNMTTFLGVCRQDSDLIARGIKPGTRGNTLAINFSTISNGVYVGSQTGVSFDAWRFHSGRLVEQVQTINGSLRRKLDFVTIMVNLLEKHLEKSGTDQRAREAVRTQINSYMSSIRRIQSEYLTEVIRWNQTLSGCLDQALAIEIDRQNEILELERQHLREVWAQMTALRNSGASDVTKESDEYLRSTLGLQGLNSAQNYRPVGHISTDEYIYAELDVLLRMRMHLQKVAPNVRVVMPSDLTDTSFWRERKLVPIAYDESEEAFVQNGLRSFNPSPSSYIRWLSTTSDPVPLINRLKLLVELYKVGTIEIFDTNASSCQGNSNISACPMTTHSVSAAEIVNETARIIEMLSLTENGGQLKKDTTYLQLLGTTARYPKDKLRGFLLDSNGDPISLMETLHGFLVKDESNLNQAREFNATERSVGHFLFSPEQDFKTILGRGFKPLVDSYFTRINDFEKAVLAKEKADAKSGKILEYGYELRPGGIQRS